MHPERFDFESWGCHTTRQRRFSFKNDLTEDSDVNVASAWPKPRAVAANG